MAKIIGRVVTTPPPKKLSKYENDEKFVTETELANKGFAKTTDIPTDYAPKEHTHSQYLTEHQKLDDYAKKTDVTNHNTSEEAHNDIRLLIEGLTTRLNTLANSDDVTLDQMKEVVAYIKNNKSLIDSITTSKVNVNDIIDNLTTSVTNKPLSAKQGLILKGLVDELSREIVNLENNKANKTEVATMVETEVENEKGNIVQLLIEELQGLPVFGVVDENNKITVTSQLSDGTYTLMYENEDGTTTEIGTMTIGSDVVIINLFDKTADGFGNNTRLSSSDGGMKAEGSVSGGVVTNFIHFPNGASGTDTLCFKGIRFDISLSDGNTPIAWRYSSKDQTTKLGAIYINSLFTQQADKMSYDATTGITTYIPNGSILEGEYVRFGGVLADGYTIDDIVITFNQAIE